MKTAQLTLLYHLAGLVRSINCSETAKVVVQAYIISKVELVNLGSIWADSDKPKTAVSQIWRIWKTRWVSPAPVVTYPPCDISSC